MLAAERAIERLDSELRELAATAGRGAEAESAAQRLAEAESSIVRQFSTLQELDRRLEALAAASEIIDRQRATLEELDRRLHSLAAAGQEGVPSLAAQLAEHGRQLRVRTVMDWVARASVTGDPLISVVLPTRDRQTFLRRALTTLVAQSHSRWEALVIDDASVDGTAVELANFGDRRVKVLRGRGAGTCAARNLGLAHAAGELIAYLDDDNLMHPEWLKTVAWAFEQRPEADVLYGAFVVDDPARIKRNGQGEMPQLFFHPYDHKAVARDNIADIGCIAHRAGLAEARFDESLREMGDWDLFLRLTRDKPPLAVPAIACFYTTDAPNRATNGPTHERDLAAVRQKNRR